MIGDNRHDFYVSVESAEMPKAENYEVTVTLRNETGVMKEVRNFLGGTQFVANQFVAN